MTARSDQAQVVVRGLKRLQIRMRSDVDRYHASAGRLGPSEQQPRQLPHECADLDYRARTDGIQATEHELSVVQQRGGPAAGIARVRIKSVREVQPGRSV